MTLTSLKSILYSTRGTIQSCVVYDMDNNIDLLDGCSIEHAIQQYGEAEVKHIQAYNNDLIITI